MDASALTWTALLGQWMDFARASVAWPPDGEGDRWRQSVSPIITLQAVTFALDDLDRLSRADWPVARDKAEILIRQSVRELGELWRGVPMPEMVLEVAQDARNALSGAYGASVTELIWPGPGTMIMPQLHSLEVIGTLAVMMPGTIVMPGEPVAWWIGREAVTVEGCQPHRVDRPRQVYRQIDQAGRITGDLIAVIEDDLPPGMPLLVPLFDQGEPIGHFTMTAEQWLARQREAMVTKQIEVREAM